MDKVTLVKSQLKLEHWRQVIAECQSSDMQVKDWLEQNDISKDQYYYWLRKVREQAVKNIPVDPADVPMVAGQDNVVFKPLEITSPANTMQTAAVIHLSQATIEIAKGADKQTVEAVLSALMSVC